jgi:hypothetical protein
MTAMRTFIALLLTCLGAFAQNITYKQLVPVSNYIDTVYSLANGKLDATNGVWYGKLYSGGQFSYLTTNAPAVGGGIGTGEGVGWFWDFLDPAKNLIGYSYNLDYLYLGDYSIAKLYIRSATSTEIESDVSITGDTTIGGNSYISGNAYDNLGNRFVTTVEATNNLRIAAGAGVNVVGAESAANIYTYTISAPGAGSSTNALSFVTTNGAILGQTLTGLGFTNSADILAAGYSNASSVYVSFTLAPAVRTGITNLVTDATNTLATFTQPASANLTNWSALSTNAILDAASNRVVVLGTASATVSLTSTNGTNYYTVTATGSGGSSLYAALATNVVTAIKTTNQTFYVDSTQDTYTFVGRPTATKRLVMLLQTSGAGNIAEGEQRISWAFNSSTTPSWTFDVNTNYFVFNHDVKGPGGINDKYVFFVERSSGVISNGYLYNDIWNLANVHNTSNMDMGAKSITNVAGIQNALHFGSIKTNVVIGISNLTVNFATNKYYFLLTNNVTLTNFSGLATNTGGDVTMILEPVLVNRGVGYPTLGGASFGIYANTNANVPMWGTLTNGRKYALSISAYGTNTFWSISEWR